jgi:hypothetical protein
VTLLRLLKQRMGFAGVTIHGLRSSFRDWAGDETHFPREVCERHIVRGVEGDYRRGAALEKRRELMDAWDRYCASTTSRDDVASRDKRDNVMPFAVTTVRAV